MFGSYWLVNFCLHLESLWLTAHWHPWNLYQNSQDLSNKVPGGFVSKPFIPTRFSNSRSELNDKCFKGSSSDASKHNSKTRHTFSDPFFKKNHSQRLNDHRPLGWVKLSDYLKSWRVPGDLSTAIVESCQLTPERQRCQDWRCLRSQADVKNLPGFCLHVIKHAAVLLAAPDIARDSWAKMCRSHVWRLIRHRPSEIQ